METSQKLEQDLMDQIETELDFCDPAQTPFICSNLTNAESKSTLARTIAQTCLQGKITIAQAIVQTEQLYSVNQID